MPEPPGSMSSLDDLEEYLASARILNLARNPARGAHQSYLAVLEGGVGVIIKPEDEGPGGEEGPVVVRREVAGWRVARELDWADLVSTTVLREVESFISGQSVMASVQVVWPRVVQPPPLPDDFADVDVCRAAVFDVIVRATDRSHNWIGFETEPGEPPGLGLIDHGHAFNDSRVFRSAFAQLKEGEPVPDDVRERVRAFIDRGPSTILADLLEDSELERVIERARRVVTERVLILP